MPGKKTSGPWRPKGRPQRKGPPRPRTAAPVGEARDSRAPAPEPIPPATSPAPAPVRPPAPPAARRDNRPPGAHARPRREGGAGAHWAPRPRGEGVELPPPERRLRNVRLVLEYDGSRFKGWQVQPNTRTVAGAVEEALANALGESVRLVGAGRTDEGVHAEAQVANFLTRWKRPLAGLAEALNERLPSDVRVVSVAEVGPEFHARHSAVSRVYRYHVARRPAVFLRGRAWFAPERIRVPRMVKATELLVGFHDFRSFADLRLAQGASTTVDVTHAAWKEAKDLLVFRIAASHFLPRMVRRIVGCLVAVGAGDVSLETFGSWLSEASREPARYTAPALGLYLEHVEYPPQSAPAAQRAVAALAAVEGAHANDEEASSTDVDGDVME